MTQIDATSATGFDPRTPGGSRFNDMTSEDFIRVIFTELQNQDPLDPSDTTAVLEQINSIRSIESDLNLANKLETLVTENQLASASSMLGSFVGGLTDDAQRVAGYVVSVVRQGDDIAVELDNGWFVNVNNVETVVDPSVIENVSPTDGTGEADASGDAEGSGSSDDTGDVSGDGSDGGDDANP